MAKRIKNPGLSKLQILQRVSRRELARNFSRPRRDVTACADLIDLGYLDGWVTLGTDNQPVKIADLKITDLGEEFLEQQEAFRFAARPVFNKKTRVLLKGLAWYFLLVGFFILLRASGGIAAAPTNTFAKKATIEKYSHVSATRRSFMGVCGIPPVE